MSIGRVLGLLLVSPMMLSYAHTNTRRLIHSFTRLIRRRTTDTVLHRMATLLLDIELIFTGGVECGQVSRTVDQPGIGSQWKNTRDTTVD